MSLNAHNEELKSVPVKGIKTQQKQVKKKKTPLMEQYDSIKEEHPQELLLFRMGDFYELFNEDAKTASKVLNITLTKRNKKSGDETLMCGFPHHAMEAPINKLLSAGYCVAVCNQLESPAEAKGLVKRGVTLRLSPGVVFNTSQLDQDSSHYVFTYNNKEACWFEPSTGKAFHQFYKNTNELRGLVLKVFPKEILVSSEEEKRKFEFYKGSLQNLSERGFTEKDFLDPRVLILSYVKKMQGEESLFGFLKWDEVKNEETVSLSSQFFKHVEVFESNEGDKKKSLFYSLKKTKTPGGSRLLRQWMESPLVNLNEILFRQKAISNWKADFSMLQNFRTVISELGDFERRVTRAGHPLGSPQDLVRLKKSLEVYLEAFSGDESKKMSACQEVFKILESSVVEDSVAQWQSKGGYLKKGYCPDLDKLIDVSSGAQDEVVDLENKEKELTGISSLKIRFNNVFGFYIEVTKLHKNKVPDRYVRRQTLTNAERYTTTELSDLEERVLSAKSKKLSLEKELFLKLKNNLKTYVKDLTDACYEASSQDVFSAMAYLCIEKNFSTPTFTNEHTAVIKQGFHPVVAEDLLKKGGQNFVTNDLELNDKTKFYMITGPNMAGKSTLMRQMVVISYLGQCGLPVPAKEATLPLYDRIFTRIGASDILSEGLSTFMVEMTETAEILSNATSKSLLILDEIGRGTSSSDGSALAKSIVRYILNKLGSHTLFATHYHELTEFFKDSDKIQNIHMGHTEKEGEIIFTYKVKKGASQNSYGIEVAKLAGLPLDVISQAKDHSLSESKQLVQPKTELSEEQLAFPVMNFQSEEESGLLKELKNIKPMEMTPLEALNTIVKWQENCL